MISKVDFAFFDFLIMEEDGFLFTVFLFSDKCRMETDIYIFIMKWNILLIPISGKDWWESK